MEVRRAKAWDQKLRDLEAVSGAEATADAGRKAGFWSAAQAAESFLGDLRRGRGREEDEVRKRSASGRETRRIALRPDTAVAPAGAPDEERYVTAIPACCLRSLKEETLIDAGERRRLTLACGCGREWWITSTLDERVARRFVTHGGPRVGDGHSAA